jgi:hypothetical protein
MNIGELIWSSTAREIRFGLSLDDGPVVKVTVTNMQYPKSPDEQELEAVEDRIRREWKLANLYLGGLQIMSPAEYLAWLSLIFNCHDRRRAMWHRDKP